MIIVISDVNPTSPATRKYMYSVVVWRSTPVMPHKSYAWPRRKRKSKKEKEKVAEHTVDGRVGKT